MTRGDAARCPGSGIPQPRIKAHPIAALHHRDASLRLGATTRDPEALSILAAIGLLRECNLQLHLERLIQLGNAPINPLSSSSYKISCGSVPGWHETWITNSTEPTWRGRSWWHRARSPAESSVQNPREKNKALSPKNGTPPFP
jgi:hypothetical protein